MSDDTKPPGGKRPRKPAAKIRPAGWQDLMTSAVGGAGVRRCQASKRRTKPPVQCNRAARSGYAVCVMHGAGTSKRVRNGTRMEPALAPLLVEGAGVTPRMLEVYAKTNPQYRKRLEHWNQRSDADIYDCRAIAVQLRAVLDLVNETAPKVAHSKMFGDAPPPHVKVLDTLASVLLKIERVEEKRRKNRLGAVTELQLAAFTYKVMEIIGEYVPPERRDGIVLELQRAAGAGASDRLGLPAPVPPAATG